MYDTILVTLETTPTDRAIIDHVKQLAALLKSRVVLLHVATGVPAQFSGPNASGREVEEDQRYLNGIAAEFAAAGISASQVLAFGDPVAEILKWVNANRCDLIAMSTHGHRMFADFLYGTTASRVQHQVSVPVLLIRAH